eukprot:TRINITY_DN510_c0_g1_i6.p2 TRINITY_DN510_c0_g1~~TRINITY_DN510_c0_g1_i6.p2  ORF type:complete len:208 (-),score=-22.61 TRINITY_DN510_c0_g1_i6:288-911(-)
MYKYFIYCLNVLQNVQAVQVCSLQCFSSSSRTLYQVEYLVNRGYVVRFVSIMIVGLKQALLCFLKFELLQCYNTCITRIVFYVRRSFYFNKTLHVLLLRFNNLLFQRVLSTIQFGFFILYNLSKILLLSFNINKFLVGYLQLFPTKDVLFVFMFLNFVFCTYTNSKQLYLQFLLRICKFNCLLQNLRYIFIHIQQHYMYMQEVDELY